MSGPFLAYLARRFVAGESMQDALQAVSKLNKKYILASLDVLGEEVSSREEALKAQEEYLDLLTSIEKNQILSNISLKLTQMGLDISDDFCFGLVESVVHNAKRSNNFVRIDMEGSKYTQRTIDMFKRLYAKNDNVGLVLQAYLHRSEGDARDFAKIKAPIRVCKGAYKEPESIAYKNMDDIRNSYQAMVKILIEGGSKVGIATHDDKLIAWAKEWTTQNHIPRSQFEFQFLYGLKRSRAVALANEGYTVRSYVPFGSHWMPYFIRRLRERKENVFFVLKGLFES